MQTKLLTEITRRKEKIAQNYLKGVGQVLKKKRIELKMTQELAAIGICSNTYLSKIENNQITVNQEHLYLLMERMNIPTDKISFPSEMLKSLEKAVTLFFYRDIDGYTELYNNIVQFDFAILLQIVKLGYYLLINDLEKAKIVHNEIFRYITILEDYGFSVFLVFSSYYNIAIKDYKNAKFTIDNIAKNLYSEEHLYGLYNHAKFLAYGNLHLNITSMDAGFIAMQIFNKYANTNRINEFYIWKEIFSVYEGNFNLSTFVFDKLKYVEKNLKNIYLIVMALRTKDPLIYLVHLEKEADNYLLGLFVKGKYHLDNSELEEYNKSLNELQELHYLKQSKINFAGLLKSLKAKDDQAIKENLINHCLDYAVQNQNLFFIEIITESISSILSKKNRYKDALIYKNKYNEYKQIFQSAPKITIK